MAGSSSLPIPTAITFSKNSSRKPDAKRRQGKPDDLQPVPDTWQLDEQQKQILQSGKPPEQVALIASMPEAEQYDVLDSLPNNVRQRMYAPASPGPSAQNPDLQRPRTGRQSGPHRSQTVARHLQRSPARRSADRFLVQPLQRLSRQGRRPLHGHHLRARCDPPARARSFQRSAPRHRAESGHAVLSR